MEGAIRVMLGGDVMLGRTVGEAIRSLGPQYPLGPVAALMRQADASIVNLECAITSSVQRWPGAPKAFYFGAPPQAIQTLTGAGVGLVSLANNHSLDYGFDGLLQTLHRLRRAGIQYAGAGIDLDEALAPAILDCQGIRLGMAAFCDHQADFAAQPDAPGMAWLDLDDEARTLAALHRALQALRREQVDWPILSLHWGPNMVWEPSERFRRLAHAAIDMGWKILFGHSAHIFHGVEIHHGCPIIYAAGDLVDDYLVDPVFRNDHQLLIELELDRDTLRGVRFYPVFIGMCQARMATPEQAGYIAERMTRACEKMGTRVNGTTLA
jgi:poly-gamma-glutamate synthesis protein (capsule biosynthesis protein)